MQRAQKNASVSMVAFTTFKNLARRKKRQSQSQRMELSDLLHPYVEELYSDTEDDIDSLFSAVYDYYLQNPDTGATSADQDLEVSVASACTLSMLATELAPTTEACGGDTPLKSRFSAPVTEAEVQTRREQAIPQKPTYVLPNLNKTPSTSNL